jgi:poly(A) polymerase
MLIRYGRKSAPQGKVPRPVAKIYTLKEHGIGVDRIDREAVKIIRRLASAGHEAYIVGGAVRDLLLGRTPKDFDIATDALPKTIRQLFKNSRIIGRRFRLVHIFFGDKIIEVSTFRSLTGEEEDNPDAIYGLLEEDVRRRDFSINALYYSPIEEQLIDYVGGFNDVKNRRLKSLIDLNKTFIEDPVRLIRAVKYAVTSGCSIPLTMGWAIKRYARELARCPYSRLTEEVFKILQCGNARDIFLRLESYRLLEHMLPEIKQAIEDGELRNKFFENLKKLDDQVRQTENYPRSQMLAALADPFLTVPAEHPPGTSLFYLSYKEIKRIVSPITPPNRDVELAVRSLFAERGITRGGGLPRDKRETRRSRSGPGERPPSPASRRPGDGEKNAPGHSSPAQHHRRRRRHKTVRPALDGEA